MIKRGRRSLAETKRANAATMALYASAAPHAVSDVAQALTEPPVVRTAVRKPRSASKKQGETHIKWAIVKAVREHPKVAWAGVFNRGVAVEGNRRVPYNYVKGFSDIAGQMRDGRILVIEAKKEEKSPITPDQVLFLDLVKQFNGVSGIAWTVEMALKIVDDA